LSTKEGSGSQASCAGEGPGEENETDSEARALILLVHPTWHGSVVNRALRAAVEDLSGVSVRHLDALYPDYQIDVEAEQDAIRAHDLIVFQHPLYWYSSPPLLKKWIDEVLLRGFAFGARDLVTRGKHCWSVVSAGGPESAYGEAGFNAYSVEDFLIHFERTAAFCKMSYERPLILHDTYRADASTIAEHALYFRKTLLEKLAAIGRASD
jgi:putative NADPH-quinone reductase